MAGRGKRGNGEGSVFYDASRRRWVALVSLPGGGRKKATAPSHKAALERRDQIKVELETFGVVFDESSRFGDLAASWATKILEAQQVAPKTRAAKRWALDRLLAEISSMRLKDLGPDRIETAFESMAADGLGRESLVKVRSVLNQVCGFGERRGLLRRNPVPLVQLPAGLPNPKEGRALTVPQAQVLLEASVGHRLHVMWCTMLTVGLRPGEAAALHWDDVDLETGVLHVRRNLRKVSAEFEISDRLKTERSRRSLDIPPGLVEAFVCHRDLQSTEREEAGAAWSGEWEGLIFTSLVGTPLDPSNVRRDLGQLTEAAGLGHWSPNELRHSCASILSDQGVPLERIADVLGHDGTRMTAKVYRHAIRPSVSAASGPMNQVFGNLN